MQSFLSELEAWVETLRADYGVPGVGLAIVKDDQLVYGRGFGVLEHSASAAVDEHSIFAIGSCTKAFTATAIALLVQEGRLRWDDRVIQYLPDFQLYDPQDTREITVRDLLCHRAGLPTFGGDFMGYGSAYNDEQALQRVRYIPPAFRLRTGYGYANLMYLAAGLVIRAVSGLGWEEFVQQRLIEPLGMTRTYTSSRPLAGLSNVAQPHQLYAGQIQSMPHIVFSNGAAAGAMVSTPVDMAAWLRFQLSGGRVGQAQLLDPLILAETRAPQVLIPVVPQFRDLLPRRHFLAYGLGWHLEDYGGRLVVSHTGGVDGMQSLAAFVPEEQLGIVLLSNFIPHYLNASLFRAILDGAFGFNDRDWRAEFLAIRQQDDERAATRRRELEESRPAGTRPSLPLAAYTGEYHNPIYGPVRVVEAQGRLVLQLGAHPGVVGPLEHWHTDTFFCRWSYSTLEEGFVPFGIGLEGRVDSLKIKVADFVDPLVYEFRRV